MALLPPAALTGTVARVVLPSMKLTEPPGLPRALSAGSTVAVKVTDWPNVADVADAARVVVVAIFATLWVIDSSAETKWTSPE